MNKNKFIVIAVAMSIITSIINAQEPVKMSGTCYLYKDTIQINEIKIKDSIVMSILDSAFIFLKYTSANSIPDYFELYSNRNVAKLKQLSIYARNMYVYGSSSEMTAKKYLDKYCLVYKGFQILIDSSYIKNYWLGQYFTITGDKIPYYVYGFYTKDKKDVCDVHDKFVEQVVNYNLHPNTKKPFTFILYRYELSDNLSYGQEN